MTDTLSIATLGAHGDPVNVNSEPSAALPKGDRADTALVPAVALALLWMASAAFVWPFDAFPVFDDWVYSFSAFQLAAGGSLVIPEWSSVYPVAQVLWGALFVVVLGADDWVLRLSTVVLAVLGHLCWYRLLCATGTPRRWALFGVAATAFHPVYFLLTLTFMTDVPMVALWQIGLYAAWRWLRDDAQLWLLLATLAGLAAAYVRQTGAALLVGLLAAALVSRPGRSNAREARLPLAAVCLVVAGVFVFGADVGDKLPMTARLADVVSALRISGWVYVDGLTAAAAFIGLSVFPLALLKSDVRWLAAAGLVFAVVWFVGEAPNLRTGTMWGACELGGAASLLSTRLPVCGWATPARFASLVAAALGWSALGPALLAGLRSARSQREPFGVLVATTFAVFTVGLAVLWLFADRYWLAPGVLAWGLLLPRGPRRVAVAIPIASRVAVAAIAFVAVTGTAAVFDFYRDLDRERLRLVGSGAAARDIDAGYAQNGRHRYLSLPRARANTGRNQGLPWVTGITVSRYTIANSAEGPREKSVQGPGGGSEQP